MDGPKTVAGSGKNKANKKKKNNAASSCHTVKSWLKNTISARSQIARCTFMILLKLLGVLLLQNVIRWNNSYTWSDLQLVVLHGIPISFSAPRARVRHFALDIYDY